MAPDPELAATVAELVRRHASGVRGLRHARISPSGDVVYLIGDAYTMALADAVDRVLDNVTDELRATRPGAFVGGLLYETEPELPGDWLSVSL